MTDDVAAARAAAEEKSAFSHPPVDPDATAAYGDDPDHVIDFWTPRFSWHNWRIAPTIGRSSRCAPWEGRQLREPLVLQPTP